MPTSVEAQGLTVDEAIQTALNQLGASRDRVEIQILHHPRGGFLGLGARRAKVKATLRKDAFRDGQEFDMAPRRRPARRRRGRGRGQGGEREARNRGKTEGAKAEDNGGTRARKEERGTGRKGAGTNGGAATEGGSKRGRRRRGGRSRGAAASSGQLSGERKKGENQAPRAGRAETSSSARRAEAKRAEGARTATKKMGPAGGRNGAGEAARKQAPGVEAAVVGPGSADEGDTATAIVPPTRPPLTDADLESLRDQAGRLTAGLIGKMGFEATVEVGLHGHTDPQVIVKVTSQAEGMLIGRRGQTLDALEHILNRMIFAGETAGSAAVTLDVGGYRERRRHSLEDMATRFRDRALIEQRAVQISPLGARDRRTVQELLADDRTVVLKVLGAGPYRRIQITPAVPTDSAAEAGAAPGGAASDNAAPEDDGES